MEAKQHITLKAATLPVTDQGTFDAVISTATIDRENDVVDPDGMVAALHKWTGVGKLIPLAWNHSSEPDDQIGHIDPASAKAVDGEVHASGWIDQSTDNGRHAWRLVKSGTLGFSFGFLIVKSADRADGGRHITELDVFEVTATPTPMNNDTRVIGWKQAEQQAFAALEQRIKALETFVEEGLDKRILDTAKEADAATPRVVDPLLARSRQAIKDIALDGVPERKPPRKPDPEPAGPASEADLRDRTRAEIMEMLRGA
jgi:HK97 family phage prohead protease